MSTAAIFFVTHMVFPPFLRGQLIKPAHLLELCRTNTIGDSSQEQMVTTWTSNSNDLASGRSCPAPQSRDCIYECCMCLVNGIGRAESPGPLTTGISFCYLLDGEGCVSVSYRIKSFSWKLSVSTYPDIFACTNWGGQLWWGITKPRCCCCTSFSSQYKELKLNN